MSNKASKHVISDLTRRTFLSGSVLGGAAFVASAFGLEGEADAEPSSGRGSEGRTPSHKGDVLSFLPSGSVEIKGWIGEKIDSCMRHRVMSQDIDKVVEPFRTRQDGDGGWRGEFWGKWFTSACLGYAAAPTPERRAVLDEAVAALLKTQSENGYIGTYNEQHQLENWDVWGRKYVMLGLIAYYDQTGSVPALDAARREADFLLTQVGPGKANITDACFGLLKGLPSSSVLEPIVLLYQRTQDVRYLRFAEYIVAQWSVPTKTIPKGMRLVEDALSGVPPIAIDSPKGYEMMSCFEGLCELYRSTGEVRYYNAAVAFGEKIVETELMVNGSCSNQELWCNGALTQTTTLEQPQETCVTATWMKFCCQLLRLTGNSEWADRMEISLYNALAGAMMPGGDWWAYHSPLAGERVPSHIQYVGLSCCVANGPRALLLTPKWAVMRSKAGLVVNLYVPGRTDMKLQDGTALTLHQVTEYPVEDTIRLQVDPESERAFEVSLRIPAWSRGSTLTVNGKPVACSPGTYARISRTWRAGDVVELTLNLSGRAVPSPGAPTQFAVMRGPILLALDTRFVPPQDVSIHLVRDTDGVVLLKPTKTRSDEVWMAFEAPFEVKPQHFFGHHPLPLTMVDFASAGNRWETENLFRTWLPQPLYLAEAYPPRTWKLMFPNSKERPAKPNTTPSATI